MTDLVEWLRAQLDEDERVAREAGGDAWHRGDRSVTIRDSVGDVVIYDEGDPSPEQAEHIIRHDPARMLREVEAKRRILDRYADCVARFRAGDPGFPPDLASEQMREYEDFVLPALALPHSDRPGYRDEWRP